MTLSEYTKKFRSAQDKRAFAERVGTTWSYIVHIVTKRRKPSATLAIEIERESGGLVRCEELCPDTDWGYIRSTTLNVDVSLSNGPGSIQ